MNKEQDIDNQLYKYLSPDLYCYVHNYIVDLKTQIDQLTNNWNELEEWLKEYIKKNDNWYNNELSTHDKQYYGDSYYTTNYMLKKFLDKMKEIKDSNDD